MASCNVVVILLAFLLVNVIAVPLQKPTEQSTSTSAEPSTPPTPSGAIKGHVCSTHGDVNADGKCVCESGFAGEFCEKVVVRGQMLTTERRPVAKCTIKVYGSSNLNIKEPLVGETTCDDNGMYSVVVDHREQYVVSGMSPHGTEGLQYYTVPQSKEERELRNRNRRSHMTDWQNAVMMIPYYMLAEMWYAHIFWGFDHSAATCDLNMFVHTPWNGGCNTDTNFDPFGCHLQNYSGPITDHVAFALTPDQNCYDADYGYEAFQWYEIGQNQTFEIFAWNSNFKYGNYENFRIPYMQNYAAGVFATAAIYGAGEDGIGFLAGYTDLKQSVQSTLYPGPYWHVFTLVVNTPPENINQELAGSGNVTIHNLVYCSPETMVYSNADQPWENPSVPYIRGRGCPQVNP